ncbi:hypothetical protein SGM_0691 [Streptomyces griseoaurantiacus M045]|uniref:Serine/arginine repetitive matrix protein 2 n=2 Tax=Streptomyces griseoaurantiacus TaxID=68213 RepID=F3NBF7_9ACTN|nr:hypothetical protein SGM_0691 [Streptomyces griseoaurantiacus M045]
MIYGVAMQPASAPWTPANAPRPGRRWYVAAAVLPVVTTALGVVLGVHALRDAVDAVDTGHRFAGGDTVTLRLDPAHGKSIWIRDRGPSSRQSCDISGPGESALTDPGIDVFLTRKETWNPLFGIDVSQAGEYRVTCSSRGGPSQYALGEAGGLLTLGGRLFPALLLPVVGLFAGLVLALVTGLRRRGHRRRLSAARPGSGAGRPAEPVVAPGGGSGRP